MTRSPSAAARALSLSIAGLAAVIALSACSSDPESASSAPTATASTAAASPPAATTVPSPAQPAPSAAAIDPAALQGGALVPGSALTQSGGYSLEMHADGNLVMYWYGQPIWSAGTSGHDGGGLSLRTDGNLVLADGTGSYWETGTAGSGANRLSVAADGNLVLGSDGNPAVWVSGSGGARGPIASLASSDGTFALQLQADGNLVLSGPGGPQWATGTEGNAGANLALAADGNLVLASSDGTVLWSSGTAGSGATELTVGGDGNIRLVTTTGAVAWQAIAPAPAPVVAGPAPGPGAERTAPPASGDQGGGQGVPAAGPAPQAPVSQYGPASQLLAEINSYRQANGLAPLQASESLNSAARSCAAGMAATDASLAHCGNGEIIQFNTDPSPHAWLLAYENSPSHNAIMLLPDIRYFGAGVSISPSGRYYNTVNVGY